MSPILIGVASGTGPGKSTLVAALAERVGGVRVDLDSNYVDRGHLGPEGRSQVNYDEPGTIESGLLLDPLGRLAAGRAMRKPRYCLHSHSRLGEKVVTPAALIVVDGLFSLWWPELRELLDAKVYVDAPADPRLARTIRRDVTERGRQVESERPNWGLVSHRDNPYDGHEARRAPGTGPWGARYRVRRTRFRRPPRIRAWRQGSPSLCHRTRGPSSMSPKYGRHARSWAKIQPGGG